MFGNPFAFTVPDLDRTDHLVVIGANPLVSNGSLATAADFPGKLKALRKRGGRLIVIDPARTRTAELADRHLRRARAPTRRCCSPSCTRCSTRAWWPRSRRDRRARRRRRRRARRWPPSSRPRWSPPHCGVPPRTSATLAREIAAAPRRAVYGRIGTSTVEFGTLGSWLVDVVNVLTGNLDRPGGAMFPLGADRAARRARRGRPRVRAPAGGTAGSPGTPRSPRELPAAALAEEIDTPGDGQIRALITVAGNPVLSAPDGDRLSRALDGLGLHAQRRPVPQRDHPARRRHPAAAAAVAERPLRLRADNLAVRNNARYSPPVLPLADGRPDEPEILARLALILVGLRPDADPALVDEQVIATTLAKETADPRLAGGGPRRRRADRDARRGTGLRAPARHDAAARPVRRRVRRRPRRADAAAAQGRPARHRPRPAAAPAARGAAHPVGQGRAGARGAGRRRGRGCAAALAGARRRASC